MFHSFVFTHFHYSDDVHKTKQDIWYKLKSVFAGEE